MPPPLIFFDDTGTSLNVVNNHGDFDSDGQLCRLIDLTGNATQAESSAITPQEYGHDSNQHLFRYESLPIGSIPFKTKDSATDLSNPQVDSSFDDFFRYVPLPRDSITFEAVQNRLCYVPSPQDSNVVNNHSGSEGARPALSTD